MRRSLARFGGLLLRPGVTPAGNFARRAIGIGRHLALEADAIGTFEQAEPAGFAILPLSGPHMAVVRRCKAMTRAQSFGERTSITCDFVRTVAEDNHAIAMRQPVARLARI